MLKVGGGWVAVHWSVGLHEIGIDCGAARQVLVAYHHKVVLAPLMWQHDVASIEGRGINVHELAQGRHALRVEECRVL